MKEIREFLEACCDQDLIFESGIELSNDPSIIGASLAALADFFNDAINDEEYRTFASIAIERIFQSVADSTKVEPEEFKKYLYRVAVETVTTDLNYFYRNHPNELFFMLHEQQIARSFKWPVVWRPTSNTLGSHHPPFAEVSAPKIFGYTVGNEGWPKKKRQEFWSDFMELQLPPEVKRYCGDEYGDPLTIKRLRKVANLLAGNVNLRAKHPRDFSKAMADWTEDLSFLKNKYYEGLSMKFLPWPSAVT